jgi:hypothetical protein
LRKGGWPVTDVRYPDTVINGVPVMPALRRMSPADYTIIWKW